MPLSLEVYEPRHIPAAMEFNQRLLSFGIERGLLIAEQPARFDPSLPISSQSWVVVDGENIRGGYTLQWRDFWIGGERRRVCAFQTPISEGIVDRRYATAGVHIIRHALSINPLLYAVGMGGVDRPLPRMLKAFGFTVTAVPFLFRVNHPGRFLGNIEHLRASTLHRLALDLMRFSGLGWLGERAWHTFSSARYRDNSVGFEQVSSLDGIADEIWERSRGDYSCLAFRDADMLQLLFSSGDRRFQRIDVSRGNQRIGWAVVLQKTMAGNKYFGDMNIGVIADCLARPADAPAIIQAAADYMAESGVDMTLANFQHPAWIEGCRKAGFLRGPSNHAFTMSQKLSGLLPSPGQLQESLHLTRSDSDGLVNLS
jgi:hypothetical protein